MKGFSGDTAQANYAGFLRELLSSRILNAIFIVLFAGIVLLVAGALAGWGRLAELFGGVLVVSGTTAIVYEYFLRRAYLALLREQTRYVLEEILPLV